MASMCVDEGPDVLASLNQVFHSMGVEGSQSLYISCARGSVKRAGEKYSVAGCQTRNCWRTTGDGRRLHSRCGKSQYAVMWNAILQRITRYSHKANHVYTRWN